MSFARRPLIWIPPVLGAIAGSALPSPASDLLLGLVVLPAMVLTATAARRLGGSHGWRLITIGALLIGFSPAITEVHRGLAPGIGPLTVGDAVLVVGYALFIVGFRMVLTARTMALQVRSMLDAGMTALWVGFLALAWAGPRLTERLDAYGQFAAVLYLPLSLALVYYALRLVLGSESRSASVVLLSLGSVLTVVSEVSFLAAAAGEDGARSVGVGTATLALVALAAAVRDPSAPEIETPVAGQQEPLTLARSIWLVVSFLAAAGSFVVFPRPPWYLAVLLAAIGLVTSINLFATIRERERMLLVERALRVSLADVLRAESPDLILERGGLAADRLLSNKLLVQVDLLRRDGDGWTVEPDGHLARADDDLATQLAAAVEGGRPIRREGPSELPGIRFTTTLALPITAGNDHIDVLVVEASPVLSTIEIEQLGQVGGAIGRALVAHDLTEASHQRRSDRRFRALVQDSSDVVALIDPETLLVTLVSPSLHRILGHREQAMVGSEVTRFLHQEDAAEIDHLLRTAIRRSTGSPVDVRLQHVDGHYHWFSATVRDHTDDDEVGGIVLNLTDIHRRKLAELSLGFSEQRFRELVLNSRDVFAVLDPDLTITYVSPNVEALLGHPAADLMATRMSTLLTDPAADRLRALLGRTGVHIHNQVVELDIRTRAGDVRMAEITVSDRTDDEPGFLLTLSDITERRRLEQSLRDQALYDSLTGLANRATLHHELQRLLQGLEPDRHLGLIHIDIDEIKEISRSVGFEAGDALLVQVATRLRARLRSDDLLSRVGGQELAIAVEGGGETEIVGLANAILDEFDDPFEVAGRSWRLTASIGVDTTDDRSSVAGDLLSQASLAAASIAGARDGGVRVFEPSLRSDATTRFELATDLQEAIARGQLHVVYQPILEMEASTVRGVEALLRWTHPERGPISPGVFIPLAESTGFIKEMGRWVLQQACDQLAAWDLAVTGAQHLGVSVNVSAIQLEEEGEAAGLAAIVVRSGIDPSRVTIELTESTLIDDPTWIRSQLQAMRELGMRVAVDDFGTGAAGLSHLRDVPFNVIKIDKSYVDALRQSEEAKRLVQGVIDLAHTLGARTVAEGIEEPGELELLRSMGCDLGQGFYLGRPMEPDQLQAWFDRGRAGSAPALIATDAR